MSKKKCYLIIPGDRSLVKLVSLDKEETYFSADDLQADRVADFVGAMVGGDYYAFYEGELAEEASELKYTNIDFDTKTEIVFDVPSKSVSSIKISWIP